MSNGHEHDTGVGGELVVHRGDDFVGALFPVEVFLDDQVVARLSVNERARLRTTPGQHELRAGKSAPVSVMVPSSGAAYALVAHPPPPKGWRALVTPPRQLRPSVTLTAGPAEPLPPGEPTVLQREALSFVSFNITGMIVIGLALLAAAVLVAVLGRSMDLLLVLGAPSALMGSLMVAAGMLLRRWLRRKGGHGVVR